jgi:hypothetical protein
MCLSARTTITHAFHIPVHIPQVTNGWEKKLQKVELQKKGSSQSAPCNCSCNPLLASVYWYHWANRAHWRLANKRGQSKRLLCM